MIAVTAAICLAAVLVVTGSDTSPDAGPVTVEIRNALGPDQVREKVTVFVDARGVGVLRVDERSPSARLRVTLPEAGRHDVRLEAERVIKGRALSTASTTGTIDVDDGRRWDVYSSDKGDTHLLLAD